MHMYPYMYIHVHICQFGMGINLVAISQKCSWPVLISKAGYNIIGNNDSNGYIVQGLAVIKGYSSKWLLKDTVSLYTVVWCDCFLMNSKIQSKWLQEGRACPTSRYSPRKYIEIECVYVLHCLLLSSWEPFSLQLWVAKTIRILTSKSLRAYTMPGKLNTQQSKPQREGLNMLVNLLAICHTHCSFSAWARTASISRKSAFIAWNNAFNFDWCVGN